MLDKGFHLFHLVIRHSNRNFLHGIKITKKLDFWFYQAGKIRRMLFHKVMQFPDFFVQFSFELLHDE